MEHDQLVHNIRRIVEADPAAKTAIELLSPFGPVYVVGGAPRDMVMGKKHKDIDLMAKIAPEVVEKVLKGIPHSSFKLTGDQFPVYRFTYGGSEVEIAMPRTEIKTGEGNKDWAIVSDHTIPPEKDLERRDFTANAIAVDPVRGQVVDPFGGIEDIKRGVVRTVTPTSFRDDSTRTLRALTQISKHGLQPDQETLEQMRQYGPYLQNATKEIMGDELDKIIKGQYPHDAIRIGHHAGVLEHYLPEVSRAFGFDQKNPNHKLDLGTHLLEVLKNTAAQTDDPDVRIAALLHDIGKPDSFWQDEKGVGHYYRGPNGEGANHEEVGAIMTEDILRRLKFPTKRIARISHLVHHHMFPAFNSGKGARKFLQRVNGPENANDLLILRQADHTGKGNEHATKTMVDHMRELVDNELNSGNAFSVNNLAINGRDVIQTLGIKPGPQVGEILRQAMELVLQHPELNTRQNLLSIIQSLGSGGSGFTPTSAWRGDRPLIGVNPKKESEIWDLISALAR